MAVALLLQIYRGTEQTMPEVAAVLARLELAGQALVVVPEEAQGQHLAAGAVAENPVRLGGLGQGVQEERRGLVMYHQLAVALLHTEQGRLVEV